MNISKLINQLLPAATDSPNSAGSGLNVGSLATGAALGGAAGFLANSTTARHFGRKALRTGRSVAGLGGLALIGTLAYRAISAARDQHQPNAIAAEDLEASAATATNPLLVLRSMIAAAHADGQLDPQEQDRIIGQMHESGLSNEERHFLMRELHNPISIEALRAQCTNVNDGASLYAAAVLAIEIDTAAERAYLDQLAAALALPADWTKRIEQQADVA